MKYWCEKCKEWFDHPKNYCIHYYHPEGPILDKLGGRRMEGTIARIIAQKSFGFIHGQDKKDYFFHRSDLNGFFDDLVADYEGGRIIKVEFESVPSQKGLRAGNVTRMDMGI